MKKCIMYLLVSLFINLAYGQTEEEKQIPIFKKGSSYNSYYKFFFPEDPLPITLLEKRRYVTTNDKNAIKQFKKYIPLPRKKVVFEKEPKQSLHFNSNGKDYTVERGIKVITCFAIDDWLKSSYAYVNIVMKGEISLFGFRDTKSIAKVLRANSSEFQWYVKKDEKDEITLCLYVDEGGYGLIDIIPLEIKFKNDVLYSISTLSQSRYFMKGYLNQFLNPDIKLSCEDNKIDGGKIGGTIGIKILENENHQMKRTEKSTQPLSICHKSYKKCEVIINYVDNKPVGDITITAIDSNDEMKLVGPSGNHPYNTVTGKGKLTFESVFDICVLTGNFHNSLLEKEGHALHIPNGKVTCIDCNPNDLIRPRMISGKLEVVTHLSTGVKIKTIGEYEKGYAVNEHEKYLYTGGQWEFVEKVHLRSNLFGYVPSGGGGGGATSEWPTSTTPHKNEEMNAIFARPSQGQETTCPVCKGMKRIYTEKVVEECETVTDNDAVFYRTKVVCKDVIKTESHRCSRCKGKGTIIE